MEDQAVSQRVGGPAAHVPGPGGGPARVVRCGWLKKQGGFVKTWHTRWFVLRREQLCYYKDEEENKALVSLRRGQRKPTLWPLRRSYRYLSNPTIQPQPRKRVYIARLNHKGSSAMVDWVRCLHMEYI
jgi:hypothetical protein